MELAFAESASSIAKPEKPESGTRSIESASNPDSSATAPLICRRFFSKKAANASGSR